MSAVPWYADDAGFAAELARGRRSELGVAVLALLHGLWTKMDAEQEGKVGGSWRDYSTFADQADIRVEGGHLLEVKGRRFRFTGPDDYPFSTAFVGARRRWESRSVDPCLVVIVSEPTGALAVVPGWTRPFWTVEQSHDSRRGFLEESLAAPSWLLLPEAWLLDHLSRPCGFCEGGSSDV